MPKDQEIERYILWLSFYFEIVRTLLTTVNTKATTTTTATNIWISE